MLSDQFRELTRYLHAFNEMQLDSLRARSCGSGVDPFLCELVTRFIDEEHERRYRRHRPLKFIQVAAQPQDVLARAAAAAQQLAVDLSSQRPDPLTSTEWLPVGVFLEQLAMRLQQTAQVEGR